MITVRFLAATSIKMYANTIVLVAYKMYRNDGQNITESVFKFKTIILGK